MMLKIRLLVVCLIACSTFHASTASAFSLGVMGGLSSLGGGLKTPTSSTGLSYGGELTFGTLYDFGVFYEKTKLGGVANTGTASTDAYLNFYGVLARLYIDAIFFDMKAGLSLVDVPSSSSKFSYGVGAGYKYSLAPMIALMPRVGYRSLGEGNSTLDFGVIFAVLF